MPFLGWKFSYDGVILRGSYYWSSEHKYWSKTGSERISTEWESIFRFTKVHGALCLLWDSYVYMKEGTQHRHGGPWTVQKTQIWALGMQSHDNMLLQKKEIGTKINRHLATKDKGAQDKEHQHLVTCDACIYRKRILTSMFWWHQIKFLSSCSYHYPSESFSAKMINNVR